MPEKKLLQVWVSQEIIEKLNEIKKEEGTPIKFFVAQAIKAALAKREEKI